MFFKRIIKILLFALIAFILFVAAVFLIDKILTGIKSTFNGDNEARSSFFSFFKKDDNSSNTTKNSWFSTYDKDDNKKTDTNLEDANANTNKIVIDADYEPFYFDDNLLLYGGKQNGNMVVSMIDRIIEDTDQELFSHVDVTIKNFGGLDGKITFTSKEEYVSRLTEIKNSINNSGKYNVSYGYSKYGAYANEVIIEKL